MLNVTNALDSFIQLGAGVPVAVTSRGASCISRITRHLLVRYTEVSFPFESGVQPVGFIALRSKTGEGF